MKLTPELETEASEPKFKVGDKVYVGLTGKIAQVTKIIDDDVVNVANKNNEVRAWVSNICHANPENYERLQATFTDIEFEAPPVQGAPNWSQQPQTQQPQFNNQMQGEPKPSTVEDDIPFNALNGQLAHLI